MTSLYVLVFYLFSYALFSTHPVFRDPYNKLATDVRDTSRYQRIPPPLDPEQV
jgi:hypothetical protein